MYSRVGLKIHSNCLLTEVFAKAWLLETPKRWGNISLVVGVHKHGSSLQPLAHIHGLVNVAREHAWSQTVLRVIGSLQHAVHISGGWRKRAERGYEELSDGSTVWYSLPLTYPSLNLDTTMTGPKDSSLAMNMWSSTSVNTVGSIKKPEGRRPPIITLCSSLHHWWTALQ